MREQWFEHDGVGMYPDQKDENPTIYYEWLAAIVAQRDTLLSRWPTITNEHAVVDPYKEQLIALDSCRGLITALIEREPVFTLNLPMFVVWVGAEKGYLPFIVGIGKK